MKWLCTLLSFLRVPLATLLLVDSPFWRIFAITGAMSTDVLDGFLARRYGATSRLGTLLDPLTDKFFALVALSIFFYESKISGLEALAFLSRDLFLIAFTIYLFLTRNWGRYKVRALTWGKVSTSFQFIVLIVLAAGLSIPSLSYSIFVAFGALSFRDFYLHLNQSL